MPGARPLLLDRFAIALYAAICLAAAPCLILWMTFSEVLLASELRDDGRVLACTYFTGAGVKERQRPREAGEAASDACPLFRRSE